MSEWHQATQATFRPLDREVAAALVAFATRRNLNKSIEIAGRTYTLDYISHSTSAFWRSRGISIYFRTGRSVVRISDHWTAANAAPRSRKMNCGRIGRSLWSIENAARHFFEASAIGSGRYPYRLLAGICGLTGFRKLDYAGD